MKKKAVQTLVFLNSQLNSKLDSNTILKTINNIPKSNLNNITANAYQYAVSELQNNYGIEIE